MMKENRLTLIMNKMASMMHRRTSRKEALVLLAVLSFPYGLYVWHLSESTPGQAGHTACGAIERCARTNAGFDGNERAGHTFIRSMVVARP